MGKGPSLAAKATSRSPDLKKRPGKPRKILKGPKMRKLQGCMGLFKEIRKAQKCVDLCIPKRPFQRMVRSICEEACWNTKRWKIVALMALQEAAEDSLLEYFSDMTVVAAHAQRLTVMDKDSETLKRVRWRYDKLLEPNVCKDEKMREILLYPPELLPEVTITDVTHEVNTRAREEQDARQAEILKETSEKQKKRAAIESSMQRESNSTLSIEASNREALLSMIDGLLAQIPFIDGIKKLVLDTVDINILLDPDAQITASIIYVCLKYVSFLLSY
ncbi:hypothetical protein L7F22_060338 [Adiantum nelumboides]|nr:hypothetical protein [Adiantum nelumboides]